MDGKTLLAIVSLAVTMGVGFWTLAAKMGRTELKIDLLWEAYVSDRRDARVGGNRRYDPPGGR